MSGRTATLSVIAGEITPSAVRDIDPDDDVLGLVASGAIKDALRHLMHRHGAAIYRYCRGALHDTALADDVHQQVFIEVFRDLPAFRGRSTLRTWLFAIARHRVLDAVKKSRRSEAHADVGEADEVPDPRPSPAESVDDAQLYKALVASLGELGEEARTALLLRYQHGFTFEEMAEICREKPGTLQARVARALPQLRVLIEARLGRPHDDE